MPNCTNLYFSGCEYSRKLITKMIEVFNVKQFIESGTFKGKTTEFISQNYEFMDIITFEISEQFYNEVLPILSKYKNVKCILGDSGKLLNEIEKKDDIVSLYYLDAHFFSSSSESYNPLRDELNSIFQNSKGKEIIVIDDFKVPNRVLGFDYPLDINYIDNLIDKEKWIYFYKDRGENYDTTATGQIYILNKNLGENLINSFIKYENGIPYSNIT